MTHPVFISYARGASAAHARALAEKLGTMAFMDTYAIDDGDQFPPHLLESLLNARVVIIFATETYSQRRFCRLEMRLALAGGNESTSHLVLALGEGAGTVLDAMPTSVAGTNWPPADATERLEALVRDELSKHPAPLRHTFSETEARKLATAFIEESNVPEPQSFGGIVCSLPQGAAAQSIGSRFVGRGDELRRIHMILSEGVGARAQLTSRITAGAGFGKTRLAVEYLHRYGPRYYPGGLFWVNAASRSLEGEMWRVLSALDRTVPDLAVMRARKRDVRQELQRTLRSIALPALYVIDNIPEANPGEDASSIEDFCPALGAVTVLATSRQDTREEGVKTLPVGSLGRDAAILLLTDGVPGAGKLPWTDWGRIAAWVGDLPIALDLLNRCLYFKSISMEMLLQRVSQHLSTTKEIDRLRDGLRGQVPQETVQGVTEAFGMSFGKLDEAPKIAAMILAQLGPAPIPEAFVASLPREYRSPAVRTALRSRHFVSADLSDLSFGIMHRLTADFLRCLVRERSAEVLEVACQALVKVMTPDRCRDPHQWALLNLFLPHAEALLDRVVTTKPIQVALTVVGIAGAVLASTQGDHATARRLEERVVEVTRDVLGENHPDTLAAMNNLAQTLWELGDQAGARHLQERTLAVMTGALGKEHTSTLASMGNLALMLREHGDYDGARRLQECILEVNTRVRGEADQNTLRSMNNLALTMQEQGDWDVARRLQERVVEVSSRLLGEEHSDTLKAITNLASTLYSLGDLSAARKLEERGVEVTRSLLGEEHPNTLVAIVNLASTLRRQGDLSAARQLEEGAVEVSRRVLGEEHPTTLKAAANLAFTLRTQGDHMGARRRGKRVLDVSTRALGGDHPDTLTAMGMLGIYLIDSGEREAGLELLRQCLIGRRKVLGDQHSETRATLSLLAQLGYEPES